MKRKCVIFGTTDFGKMLRYYFEKYADVQIVAYTVDKAYLESDTYDGLPAVAYEEVEKAYPPTEYTMVIALGYKKMNQIRQQKFEDAKRKGYRIENFVHPSVVDESVAMEYYSRTCYIGVWNKDWKFQHYMERKPDFT